MGGAFALAVAARPTAGHLHTVKYPGSLGWKGRGGIGLRQMGWLWIGTKIKNLKQSIGRKKESENQI